MKSAQLPQNEPMQRMSGHFQNTPAKEPYISAKEPYIKNTPARTYERVTSRVNEEVTYESVAYESSATTRE